MSGYRVEDEPKPGALSRTTVNPRFPMLAMMFAGAWLAWPWFVLNAAAMGSPTRVREQALAALGFGGSIALALLVWWTWPPEMLDERSFRFALLALDVWKLGIAYFIYSKQSRTFAVYEYYGGPVKNGVFFLTLGSSFLKSYVIALVDHELWLLVVS